MEGLQCEPCQTGAVETKTHKEGEALEEHAFPTETWSKNSNKTTSPVISSELVIEDASNSSHFSEPLLGLILKTPASLHPVCFSRGPIILPVEVQLVGGVQPQTTATPVITSAPGCLTLPLIFDQAHVQYLSSLSSCPITEQQNFPYFLQQDNELPQNLSCLAKGQSQSGDGKSNISEPSENSTMHSSEFLAALQELLRNYSCRGSSSVPLNAFSTGFISPNTTNSQLYTSSSLVSLFPPATLLVPYPLIVPLPVPLPIPIPFPFFPNPGSIFRSSHTIKTSKSTQTMTEDIPVSTHNKISGYDFLCFSTQPPLPVSQEQVLDLTVKVVPIQTKKDVQFSFHQDSILDLSMAKKSRSETGKETQIKHPGRNSTNEDSTKLFGAVKRSQTQRIYQPHGYSNVEFSMQYKWPTQERYENYAIKYSGQNGRTQMQIPKFPRPNTDTSVTYCEKLARPPEGQVLKNRPIKQRRLNTQHVNLPPVKKPRLMAFYPTKQIHN